MPKPMLVRRRRPPFALFALIAASMSLMAVQLRMPENVALASQWTVAVFAPLFEAGAWTAKRSRSAAAVLLSTQSALRENERLRRATAELKVENQLLHEEIARLERERAYARTKAEAIHPVYLHANVIAYSMQPLTGVITIDRGRLDGVPKDMPVVDYDGCMVGKVIEVSRSTAIVRLLSDPAFNTSAFAISGEERRPGRIEGAGHEQRLRFRPTEPQTELDLGAALVTSGFEGSLYPKGLRIGTIVGFGQDKQGIPFAEVKADAEFDSLEEVLLLDVELSLPERVFRVEAPPEIHGPPSPLTAAEDAATTDTADAGVAPEASGSELATRPAAPRAENRVRERAGETRSNIFDPAAQSAAPGEEE